MLLVSREVEDLLRRVCMPGDFARGQRTLPATVSLPHGYFARGQLAGPTPSILLLDH